MLARLVLCGSRWVQRWGCGAGGDAVLLLSSHCPDGFALQFHDKIEPMLETLDALSSRLRVPPLIPAEVDKIRECISENKNATVELEKLQPSFEALKRRGEELVGRSQGADKDLAAKGIGAGAGRGLCWAVAAARLCCAPPGADGGTSARGERGTCG